MMGISGCLTANYDHQSALAETVENGQNTFHRDLSVIALTTLQVSIGIMKYSEK
jgi:hypothetical protein